MKALFVAALLVAASAAAEGTPSVCHHGGACPGGAEAAAAPPKSLEKGQVLLRGEKLGPGKPVAVGKLLEAPQAHDGKKVLVEGTVRQACTRKGCWMELAETPKGPGVRVTFKDYGFFVPTDSAGAKARVEGEVKLAELSEETAKHYESEGATVPRGKDGKPREVHLLAAGVELRR